MSTSERGMLSMYWENSPKEWSTGNRKKENWIFCKVYKENQKDLEKYPTSVVCVSYESDLQLK